MDETAKLCKVHKKKKSVFGQKLINTKNTNYMLPDNKNSIMYMFPSFTELGGGKHQLIFPIENLNLADKQAAKLYMKQHTEDVCNNLSHRFSFWPFSRLNYLYNVFDLYNVLHFWFSNQINVWTEKRFTLRFNKASKTD